MVSSASGLMLDGALTFRRPIDVKRLSTSLQICRFAVLLFLFPESSLSPKSSLCALRIGLSDDLESSSDDGGTRGFFPLD